MWISSGGRAKASTKRSRCALAAREDDRVRGLDRALDDGPGRRNDLRARPARQAVRGLVERQRRRGRRPQRRLRAFITRVVPVDDRRVVPGEGVAAARRGPRSARSPSRRRPSRSPLRGRSAESGPGGREDRRAAAAPRRGAPRRWIHWRVEPPASRLWSRQQTLSTPSSGVGRRPVRRCSTVSSLQSSDLAHNLLIGDRVSDRR